MFLPNKKSSYWIYIFAIVFVVNMAAILFSRFLINNSVDLRNIIGFAVLSLFLAIFASLGYFGRIAFSTVFILFNMTAIGYMYYLILSNKSNGWSDLVSVAGFISIIGFGIISGAIIEVISIIDQKRKGK